MNKAFIIGNLTRDPDVKMTPNGISVCTFTVAVQRRYKDQNGERQADFIPVVTWRGLADTCGKYLSKGRKVAVAGAINVRNYDAQDGTKRYVTEIVADDVEFLTPLSSSGGGGGNMSQGAPPQAPPAHDGAGSDMGSFTAVDDDELPF